MELFDQNGDEIKRENKQYKRQTETSRKEQKKKHNYAEVQCKPYRCGLRGQYSRKDQNAKYSDA